MIRRLAPAVMLLAVAGSGCTAFEANARDPWLARDKALHLVVGTATGAAGAEILRRNGASRCAAVSGGLALTFSVALAKEWYDRNRADSFFSGRDIAATMLGGLLGAQLAGDC